MLTFPRKVNVPTTFQKISTVALYYKKIKLFKVLKTFSFFVCFHCMALALCLL